MAHFAVFREETIQPFAGLGLTHHFWAVNTQTLLATWAVIAILLGLTLATRLTIKNPNSMFRFLVVKFVANFKALIDQTIGAFHFRHFSFIASLFIFILACNLISIIPGLEEPTSDIMTTLALGIIAFGYTQFSAIESNGLKKYLKSYLEPFFIMLPLNIIGNLASIISISFRLFGNIFGGAVISHLWYSAISAHILAELIGIFSGINLTLTVFFVLFEGFIQAFVFCMLSLTYLSIEVRQEPSNSGVKP